MAFDLFEDWDDTKVQIIEELSIIKGFISQICEEKKKEFISTLLEEIKILDDRISVLKAEFDYIKEHKFELNRDSNLSTIISNHGDNDKFAYITQIRRKTFKLDGEIRELLINNVEFDEFFNDLLRKWVSTKIEIQEYLIDLDRQIKTIKDSLINQLIQGNMADDMHVDGDISGINNELRFQLLQGHIQSIITERIVGTKRLTDNFNTLTSKLEMLIKKNEFSDVKKLIEMIRKE